jgi:2-oxoglutarate dehydrogenase complex dehydrogenase (E1) component-like enzyme
MRFEYGYSGRPKTPWSSGGLYGDFVNGAQAIIDEFLSRGRRWGCCPDQSSSTARLGEGPSH